MEFDVIIVGAGGAGVVASITAADAGAKVLNIEKMPRIGGVWATRGGSFTGACTKLQYKTGLFNDSPSLFYADLMRWPSARAWSDPEVLKFYCEHAGEAVDFLDGLGAFAPPWDKAIPGQYGDPWSVPRSYALFGPVLRFLEPLYKKRVERGDLVLRTSTSVLRLIQKDSKVIGVRAKGEDGKEVDYMAGAVVIATGGFGSNPELVKRNLPKASIVVSHTPAFARGEGLMMCEKVGAAIVNMDHTLPTGPYGGGIPNPNDPTREIAHVNMVKYPGAIWVNSQGKRVVREDIGGYLPPLREAIAGTPDLVLNVILDAKIRASNKTILSPIFGVPERPWEWFDEKANEGVIIKKADTIEELAGKLGIPAPALVETVARWNEFVENKKDEEFGREELSFKIENPPFFGIKTGTMVIASCGGPTVNSRMEVLDTTGKTIAGLYAAGEVMGYQGTGTGCYDSGNIVFGKQAGLMAAWHARTRR
ncbi:MAG: FAD-binding protein [Chloroflexota bacterium]